MFNRRVFSGEKAEKGFPGRSKGGGGGVPVPADCPDSAPTLLLPGVPEPLPSPPPEPAVPPAPSPSSPPRAQQPHVVVIGAGVAGLSAAAHLIDAGVADVTVLEARDRPGGRVSSTVLGDAVVEMGSDLHYPQFSNLVQHMAAADGFIGSAPTWDPARTLLVHPDGRPVDSPISMLAYYRYRQAEEQIAERFAQAPERTLHGDFAEMMGHILRMEVERFPVEHRNTAARVMTGLAAARRTFSSKDPRFIRKDPQGATLQLPGGPAIPLGLRGILSDALRRIGPDKIRYSKIVTNIHWGVLASGDAQVTVRCDDGEAIVADYAIVTLPLGVLKEQHATLFCPGLPADKIDALDCLDIFHVTKIYMAYEHSFWLWRDNPIVIRFPIDAAASSAWIDGITRLSELPGSNHVLTAVVLGKHAVTAEHLTDEEIMEVITQVLRRASADKCVPYPSDVMVSRWTSDRFSAGAGAAHNPEFGRALCATVADPVPGPSLGVPPVLFFAGEHTSAKYGTLPGAALSGLREAENVLEVVAQRGEASCCVSRALCCAVA